jgi:molybdopterin converting factor subunit 1
MITVRYFASIREKMGKDQEQLAWSSALISVGAVLEHCRAMSDLHAEALHRRQPIRTALNQTLASLEAKVQDGDEIAFFPPVTGG